MDKSYFDLVKDLLETGDTDSAITALHRAIEKGDGDACAFLGEMYIEGKHVGQDVLKAKSYFNQGARLGNQKCQELSNIPVIPKDRQGRLHPTKQNIREVLKIARKGLVGPLILLTMGVDVYPEFLRQHITEIEALFWRAIERYPKRKEIRVAFVSLWRDLEPGKDWMEKALTALEPLVTQGVPEAAALYLDLATGEPPSKGLRKQIQPALTVAEKAIPDFFHIFSGYTSLTERDGHGAFTAFSEGVQSGHQFSQLGLAYCYVHGIGTQRDLGKAEAILESSDNRDFSTFLCLARIAMLKDPSHPDILKAMDYIVAAEDEGFEKLCEESCIWLLWCFRQGIELSPCLEERFIELLEEGLSMGSTLLAELPLAELCPTSFKARRTLWEVCSRGYDNFASPIGMIRSLWPMFEEGDDGVISRLQTLVECYGLDWDILCEIALCGAFTINECYPDRIEQRDWFLAEAESLSEGVYDELIRQCRMYFALCDAYGSDSIKPKIESFLAYYPVHADEVIPQFTYSWILKHELIVNVGQDTCVKHIRAIKEYPFPNFWRLCAGLLAKEIAPDDSGIALQEELCSREAEEMNGRFLTRALVASTAIPFFQFF